MARVTVDIGPPLGAWRRISSSSSAMTFSATGFLLVFLTRPIYRDKRLLRVGSVRSVTKPGAGSTLMIAGGPSRGCSSLHNLARASRSVLAFSSWMIYVAVKDVVVSRTTMIVCLHSLRSWSWRFDGWSSLICKAVTRPSSTERGTTINSMEGDKGSVLRTTNKPSLAMDKELR
jgi:hypothetical protein